MSSPTPEPPGDDRRDLPRSGRAGPSAQGTPAPTPEPNAAPAAGDSPAPRIPPASPAPASGPPRPDPETTAAVQTALGAEHAAVWCYGLIGAFLGSNMDRRLREDLTTHRARRDTTIRVLTDSGVRPAPAEPAYRVPAPVTDQPSAMRLAVTAESDAATAWRSVLERCDDPGLRHMALDALVDAAVRGARWSAQLDTKPVVPPFPGAP
ncbi:ferritin-like domain-containing protein [Pseudonocardia acaciae]|uniref:ferritin-like domain-containing protein n=1 Tax=Pseudonocardia acaciae TaxID=551276 RepID=UPI000A03A88B|nr:ferritin-like domain-containing protein [Pseudonocardia acaciae]